MTVIIKLFPNIGIERFMTLLLVLVCASFTEVGGDLNVYRSYQSTIYCNASSEIQSHSNVTVLLQLIQNAIKNGQTVKPIGSRHSITDVICTNGIPISMGHIDYARINTDGTATFGAGIKLHDVMEFLETNNLSLIHVPTFGGISLGGAIGTGAHGSSLRHPASISDQIVRLTVIIGNGTLVEISGLELDIFRVNLGLLGIIVDVTLETVPLFKMTVEHRLTNDDILFDGSIPHLAGEYDMFQVWWFPQSKRVVIGFGNYTSADTPGNAFSNFIPESLKTSITTGSQTFERLQQARNTAALNGLADITESSLFKYVPGKAPIYTEDGLSVQNPATGYAWRLQSNICKSTTLSSCGWINGNKNSILPEESSMAFDISKFSGVMNMMKKIINDHPAAFPLVGVYIRFAKASTATMAISTGRATFSVEWATPMRQNPFEYARDAVGTYQVILQEMVANYGGRPHWGKNGLYFLSEEVLAKSVPNRQSFVKAMKHYDPNGIFINAFGNRMRGISNNIDLDPQVKHCALQDYCTCSIALDCAPYQICSQINGFPVCMDDPSIDYDLIV